MGRSRIASGSANPIAYRAEPARALARWRSHCYATFSRARWVVCRPAYSVWDPASLAPTLTLPRKRGRESALAGDVIDGDGLAEALEGEVATSSRRTLRSTPPATRFEIRIWPSVAWTQRR